MPAEHSEHRGLYIHIPFCKKKCGYCDFASYDNRQNDIGIYLDALEKEAQLHKRLAGSFDTVYIGGGTPSILSPSQLKRLLAIIKNMYEPQMLREFTVEANPESMTAEKAEILAEAGADRISMGLQSSKPELLKKIGRITSPEKFAKAWEILRKAGFRNINADLMTGLPGQTLKDFEDSVDFLISMHPEHISLYPLEIHEGTMLAALGMQENPDGAADMYDYACARLPKDGYERYEISNFSIPGKESRHNIHYWLQEEYLGLGPAAASYISGERRASAPELDSWAEALNKGIMPNYSSEKLEGRQKDAEKIILGLRLTEGIEINANIFIEFKDKFRSEIAQNFLDIRGSRIKLKPEKTYLANRLFLEFM